MAQVTNDTDDDDDFGDFSAAEKPCLNGHHTPEDGQGVISKEDDFEDFPASSENDAAAALDTQTSPPQQQSPDEDVGDFESESASASDDKLDVDVPIHQSPETNFDGNADPIENSTQDTGDTATPNATVANTVEAGSSSVDDYEAAKEENGSVEEAERDTALEATGPASPDGLVTKPAEASDSSENPNIGNIVAADETETTIKITPVEEDNGEFGDFNAPSSETGAQKIEESFGDFNDGPSNNNDGGAEPAAAEAPSTTTTDANGLGNFNESPSTAIESKTTEESLGAFNEPVSNADAGAAAAPIPLTTKDDEDFGDFGDFNVPETDTSAPIESKATEESFGDFNELMPSNVNGTATTTGDNGHGDSSDFNGPASETDVSGDPIETKATEESFGDFNAPSISDTKADDGAAQTTTSGDDDDDFGGFGDFNGPSSEPDHKGTSIESKPTEDSFGDFNEPSSKPSEAEAPATTTTSDDDEEFGDFGDFDSGENSQPPRKDQGNDNDFGSFSGGKAEAASSGFAATFEAQARPASSKEEIDPMLQKAKTVLSKVFEGFKIEGLDEKANASEKIAVAELTVRYRLASFLLLLSVSLEMI